MLIRMSLKMEEDMSGRGQLLPVPEDSDGYVELVPVVIFVNGTPIIEDILIHDLFHHAALDLGFNEYDEYLTSLLDHQYPTTTGKLRDPDKYARDVKYTRNDLLESMGYLGIEPPTRAEVKRFKQKAQRRLGYLKPYTFRSIIDEALKTYFGWGGPGYIAAECVLKDRYILTVDTRKRKARIRRAPGELTNA